MCAVDVQKAFDRVSRPLLFSLLNQWGLRGRLMEILKAAYSDNTVTLKMNGTYSDFFTCEAGVAQGDPLSPLLFIIYISCIDVTDVDDPLIDNQRLAELLLADDLTLFSTTIAGMNRKLESLNRQLDHLGLTLNPDKSKCLALSLHSPLQLNPILRGAVIPMVDEIDVNGYIINSAHFPNWDATSTILKHHRNAVHAARDLRRARRHLALFSPAQTRNMYLSLVDT